MTIKEYQSFYLHHLNEVILPFWLNRSIDYEYGGVFTCFDNCGIKLLSTDKYTWSQGRAAWMFSKMAMMDCFDNSFRAQCLMIAEKTAAFLAAHCFMDDGNVAFLLTREGRKKEPFPGRGYDTSIYADCFVALGFSKYAKASGDNHYQELADKLFLSIVERAGSGGYRSDPYPVPAGWLPHGMDMILLHTARELGLKDIAHEHMKRIFSRFYDGKLIREFVPAAGGFDNTNLLGRYVNPGHSLECMWFALDTARDAGDQESVNVILEVIKNTLLAGWDSEWGGFFLYIDHDGGVPAGLAAQPDEPMTVKVQADWGLKLWWVHSEALYTCLYAYSVSRDPFFLTLHKKVFDYTFTVFPNPDHAIGEWIQIRSRDGQPEEKVVALPVKDPYHIVRNLLMITELPR